MIKKLFLALALAVASIAPSHAAGTIAFSLSQQFDSLGKPLAGCKLYIFQAGTTTPQTAYQDTALTLPVPGGTQLTCDAAGRLPQFFLADGAVKVRLADKNGANQAYPNGAAAMDNLLVIGPSAGGGSPAVVDPTTVIATGDVKVKYGTGVLTGFVRLNGRTIGSATSGASERANSDAQTLFEYLWNADANLAVSTGRGGSSAADWAANKTITLPDFRGRVVAGLDDMGNSAAGRRTATYTGVVATVLGSVSTGTESFMLGATHIPSGLTFDTHFTVLPSQYGPTTILTNVASTSGIGVWASPTSTTTSQLIASGGTLSTTITNAGGNPHSIVDPTIFITYYLKL